MRSIRIVGVALFAAPFFIASAGSAPAWAADSGSLQKIEITSLDYCGFALSPWRERRWQRQCSTEDLRLANKVYCDYLCVSPEITASIGIIRIIGGGGGAPPGCIGPDCDPPPGCIGPDCGPPPGCAPNCPGGGPKGNRGNHYGNNMPDNNTRDVKNRWNTLDNIHPDGGKPIGAGPPAATAALNAQASNGPPEETGKPEDTGGGPPEGKGPSK